MLALALQIWEGAEYDDTVEEAKVLLSLFLRGALDTINSLQRTGSDRGQEQEGQRQRQSMALGHKDWMESMARMGLALRAGHGTG